MAALYVSVNKSLQSLSSSYFNSSYFNNPLFVLKLKSYLKHYYIEKVYFSYDNYAIWCILKYAIPIEDLSVGL